MAKDGRSPAEETELTLSGGEGVSSAIREDGEVAGLALETAKPVEVVAWCSDD